MSKAKIGIVIGSTREGRFADKVAPWIVELASARPELDVEVVDLRDYPLPFYEERTSPAAGPFENEIATAWRAKVHELDGFIFTAAEFNHGPTAVLKNALDYAYLEWARKPAAFVGYGGVGGARAIEQLRMHAVELQMAPIRTAVHILLPDFLAIAKGEKTPGEIEHLNVGANGMIDQLIWWTSALKTARQEAA